MSDDELLNVLSPDGELIGTKRRGDVHRDGDWHAAFHLWVLTGDAIVLQRRSAEKQSWPSRLDATAAGHLGAGESVLDGLREAKEELGVDYAPDTLIACGTFTVDEVQSDGTINREFQHVFAVRDDRPLDAFTDFDRVEVDGLVSVPLAAFERLLTTEAAAVAGMAWDGVAVTPITVQSADLVPAPYLAAVVTNLSR